MLVLAGPQNWCIFDNTAALVATRDAFWTKGETVVDCVRRRSSLVYRPPAPVTLQAIVHHLPTPAAMQ